MFAVDCEMCYTAKGQELTRISVVDESMTLVYDAIVKPDLPIIDYVTRYVTYRGGSFPPPPHPLVQFFLRFFSLFFVCFIFLQLH